MKKLSVLTFLLISSQLFGQTYSLNWQKNMLSNSSSIIIDSLGNTFVGSPGFNLQKRDASGSLVWTKSNFGYTYGSITFDRKGDILVFTTKTSTIGNLNDLYIGKYDTTGNLLWTTTIDFGSFDNNLASLTVDYSNKIVVTANSKITANHNDFLTVKLDANGSVIWKKSFSYSPSATNKPVSITCDSINSIYLYGYVSYTASPNNDSLIIIKYDSLGNFIKTKNVTQSVAGPWHAMGLASDLKIFLYNKKIFYSTVGWPLVGPQNYNYKLHRTDTALVSDTIVFQNQLLEGLSFIPYPQNNLITMGGTIYTYSWTGFGYSNTGILDRTYKMNMSNYSVISYSTGIPTSWGAASTLMKNGNFLYCPLASANSSIIRVLSPTFTTVTTATTIPISLSPGFVSAAGADSNNDIYHLFSNSNNTAWFLNKYSLTTYIMDLQNFQALNLVYPNPATEELNISTQYKNITRLEIFDITGKKICQPETSLKIKIRDLNPGFYILKVYESETSHSFKFIKQ